MSWLLTREAPKIVECKILVLSAACLDHERSVRREKTEKEGERENEEEEEERNNREQGSRMDWREATSASGERPAVHPDCRRPIKMSYVSLSLSLSLRSARPLTLVRRQIILIVE